MFRVDADGHVLEDLAALQRRIPRSYAEHFDTPVASLVPPLDHLHAQPMIVRGVSRQAVGVDKWLAFLDEVELEATVLYPSHGLSYGKITNYDWARTYTRIYNDWLHETYLDADPRFNGMALVPLQEPDAAIEELRYAVTELGMRGAVLPSRGLPLDLGSRIYWPFFEEADRLGCAVAIHGGCHDGIGLDHANVYAGAHALGHPVGQMTGFVDLLLNGVIDRCPNARFGFLEGGVAWMLVLIERLPRSFETHSHVSLRGEILELQGSDDIADHVRGLIASGRVFVGAEGEEPALPYAIEALGNPFMFSSDYPHEVTIESCLHELQEVTDHELLSGGDKEAFLGANAARFYGLGPD